MGHEVNLLDIEQTQEPVNQTHDAQIKRIVEALLFSTKEPLSVEKMRVIITTVYPVRTAKLLTLIGEMQRQYVKEGRAFSIDEIGEGYLLRTTEEMAPYVERLHQNRRGEKLSEAAIEVLAIVAYKGPLTRAEIDHYRGVDSSGTLASLIERDLVEGVGRKQAPGRPMQYATTTRFLTYFGLKDQSSLSAL